MNKQIFSIVLLLLALVMPQSAAASSSSEDGKVDLKGIIFHHLGDGYGWEVPFSHTRRIPLPVIVKAENGSWHCFSSNKLVELVNETDANGHEHEVAHNIIYKADDGTNFMIAPHASANKNKVVEVTPLSADEEAMVLAKADSISKADGIELAEVIVDGYSNDHGHFYKEYRPFDMSITKNVLAIFISVIVVFFMIMSVARWHKRNGMKAPRKGLGFIELVIDFIYKGVIRATLGDKAPKFAPYLLTAFFFILVMNLLGLIVIFPGGANLTGNIAVTMVLAIFTFLATNLFGTKDYWKEIFWPPVPVFLKAPLPIMPLVELLGIITKPFALMVRLFANIMGGHAIILSLTCVIFITCQLGALIGTPLSLVSFVMMIFMNCLECLVAFIQAYVFTMLSAVFIGLSHPESHHS
jgi:F-type H+-transporting ATPase subunit a